MAKAKLDAAESSTDATAEPDRARRRIARALLIRGRLRGRSAQDRRRRAGPGTVVLPEAVLRLTGELDMSSAAGVDSQLRDYAEVRGDSVVIVDLSGVTFIDSSGLDSLVRAHGDLAAHDRLLSLQSVPRAAQRLFELMRRFDYCPLLEQSLASTTSAPDGSTGDSTTDDTTTVVSAGGTHVDQLTAKVTRLHVAVHNRAALDQAKGLLMGVHGCNAAQAGALLEQISSRHLVTLDDLAECLVALAPAGRGGDAPSGCEPSVAAAARAAWGERRALESVPSPRRSTVSS